MSNNNKLKLIIRDIIKSVMYRIYSSFITFLIAYFITNKTLISLSIGISELFIKIISYFVYEQIFNKIWKEYKSKNIKKLFCEEYKEKNKFNL